MKVDKHIGELERESERGCVSRPLAQALIHMLQETSRQHVPSPEECTHWDEERQEWSEGANTACGSRRSASGRKHCPYCGALKLNESNPTQGKVKISSVSERGEVKRLWREVEGAFLKYRAEEVRREAKGV